MFIVIPSLEGRPAKAKEAPSSHQVRLAPLDTNLVFQSLGGNLCLANCILLQQCFFIIAVLLQMEIILIFSKFIIIKTTSLQKDKDTKRIRSLPTICYKQRSLKHIILQSLTIEEIITSKQQMFYQFCYILINWKTARETNV